VAASVVLHGTGSHCKGVLYFIWVNWRGQFLELSEGWGHGEFEGLGLMGGDSIRWRDAGFGRPQFLIAACA